MKNLEKLEERIRKLSSVEGDIYAGGSISVSGIVLADDEKAAVFELNNDMAYRGSRSAPYAGGGISYSQAIRVYDSVSDSVLNIQPFLRWRDGENDERNDTPENRHSLLKMVKAGEVYHLYLGNHDGSVSEYRCDFQKKKVKKIRKIGGIEYLQSMSDGSPLSKYQIFRAMLYATKSSTRRFISMEAIDKKTGKRSSIDIWGNVSCSEDTFDKFDKIVTRVFSKPERYAILLEEAYDASNVGWHMAGRTLELVDPRMIEEKFDSDATERKYITEIGRNDGGSDESKLIKFKVGKKTFRYKLWGWECSRGWRRKR